MEESKWVETIQCPKCNSRNLKNYLSSTKQCEDCKYISRYKKFKKKLEWCLLNIPLGIIIFPLLYFFKFDWEFTFIVGIYFGAGVCEAIFFIFVIKYLNRKD